MYQIQVELRTAKHLNYKHMGRFVIIFLQPRYKTIYQTSIENHLSFLILRNLIKIILIDIFIKDKVYTASNYVRIILYYT